MNKNNNSSIVESVDVLEKYSSIVEHGEIVEKAQDVEIGTGLDEDVEKSSLDFGMEDGMEDGQENEFPPLLTANFKIQKRWLKALRCYLKITV